jgi:cell division protein ZapE
MLADLVPPPRFAAARLENYVPDPEFPSQQQAKEAIGAFAASVSRPTGKRRGGLLSRLTRSTAEPARGIYLDGGFGVGKTHLLTSLFHAVGEKAVYGTFVEYTNLVGALGFQRATELLGQSRLVCIDEFELDDPGDTLLMTRLIRELSDAGVAVVATSNTLPEALGEGRFAAQDFLREIQSMAERFEAIRIDGHDYRRRDGVSDIRAFPAPAVADHAAGQEGATLDELEELLGHLIAVHPSRYGALIDGVVTAHLTGVQVLTRHNDALRFVVLIDRLYDREVPMLLAAADGTDRIEELFTPELLRSGYRKKYYRALSRIASLAHDGAGLLEGAGTAGEPGPDVRRTAS